MVAADGGVGRGAVVAAAVVLVSVASMAGFVVVVVLLVSCMQRQRKRTLPGRPGTTTGSSRLGMIPGTPLEQTPRVGPQLGNVVKHEQE